jgi:hypothetical protein
MQEAIMMRDSTTTAAANLAEAAQAYRDNHHWVPLRLEGKSPDCMGRGWQKRTLQNAIPKFESGDNIGILLGKPSGNLVRLDPDFPSIPAVVEILFPEPSMTFGRKSSPGSGRLVICEVKGKDFDLPKSMEADPRLPLHDGKPGLKVFQILSTGKQTVVPPSIHPESGEPVVWEIETPLATLDSKQLLRRVGVEAFCMAVRQFWPARGTRNDAAMALARVLLEAFQSSGTDKQRIALVDDLVVAVAMAGGDGEDSRNGKRRAEATLAKMHAGEDTIGMTRLVELLELPSDVSNTFRKWLGITELPTAQKLYELLYGSDGHPVPPGPTPQTSNSARPIIQILAGGLAVNALQAQQTLSTADVPFFERGGLLVRPIIKEVTASERRFCHARPGA